MALRVMPSCTVCTDGALDEGPCVITYVAFSHVVLFPVRDTPICTVLLEFIGKSARYGITKVVNVYLCGWSLDMVCVCRYILCVVYQ